MLLTIAARYNRTVHVHGVTLVGDRARAALLATAGRARVIAPLSRSAYLLAGEEVVWLGADDGVAHPRSVLAAPPPPLASGTAVRVDVTGARSWQPPPPPAGAGAARTLRATARWLARAAGTLGVPRGFGARIVGTPLAFPLDAGEAAARALADACLADDPDAAGVAAAALLGLGGGLTPAGDDHVGGAFFARSTLVSLGAADHRWPRVAAGVRLRARALTHPISAALLGDLLDGAGWAPLHDLVTALAAGHAESALAAARRVTALGHSSGWDVLAGFLAGLR